MKNTVKKILALVFVVAMVCSLAVPAFAADDFTKYNVKLIVVDAKGASVSANVPVASAKKANVLDTLKAAETTATGLDFSFKNNVLTAVKSTDTTKVFETADEYGTESLVVALNGKAITTDLSTVAVAQDDVIVVYWADSTIGTRLIMADDSNIAAGIVSFFSYDAEGNKVPFVGATVTITGVENKLGGDFITDEKGQIWIAPEYLDNQTAAAYAIASIAAADEDLKKIEVENEDDELTEAEKYYNDYIDFKFVDDAVVDTSISVEKNLYDVAGQTGDMTVVYALVAFAAVATIAAVVVMKKKSVKAN